MPLNCFKQGRSERSSGPLCITYWGHYFNYSNLNTNLKHYNELKLETHRLINNDVSFEKPQKTLKFLQFNNEYICFNITQQIKMSCSNKCPLKICIGFGPLSVGALVHCTPRTHLAPLLVSTLISAVKGVNKVV